MAGSRTDRLYRSVLLSKFFTKGWGKPEHLKRIFQFRRLIADRGECLKLIDPDHPVNIIKETRSADHILVEGEFESPFVEHCRDLLPPESVRAHFQLLLPRQWRGSLRPTVLHLAGTGDHYFWRRRSLLANPLLKQDGIASIMLENPFYGSRKPHDQVRSSLRCVSDLFVMGACLILESMVLFHWAQRYGLGPVGITGISMGGHMASLAASVWPHPIPLVPCLSSTSASYVFTSGVMSSSIDWDLLERQYFSDNIYKNELRNMVRVVDPVEDVSSLARNPITTNLRSRSPAPANPAGSRLSSTESPSAPDIVTSRSAGVVTHMAQSKSMLLSRASSEPVVDTAAVTFMRALMDECTHLANFPVPADPQLVIHVQANDDAYMPRLSDRAMRRVWPGCTVRQLDAGHVGAYLFNQDVFRSVTAHTQHSPYFPV